MKDSFGDRIKLFEGIEAEQKFIPLLPIVIRLDGRSFSSYTSGMEKPFDRKMSEAMIRTTIALVKETGAVIGYTQSDEITLVLYSDCLDSKIWFDGKKFKIISCAASFCANEFYRSITELMPSKTGSAPSFDCRAFNVPNKMEAANVVLWRELDASKNAISSAARFYYSHKELDGKTGSEKQELLFCKGVNFNDYPAFFKRGTFVQKRKTVRKFTVDEIEKLPQKHLARTSPDLEVERTDIVQIDMPRFSKVINRVEVVFDGADPVVDSDE